MKQKFSFKGKIAFKSVIEKFVKSFFNVLSRNKGAGGDIPLNLLNESTFVLPYFVPCVNEASVKSEPLKLSNIVPVHQKEDPTDKTN